MYRLMLISRMLYGLALLIGVRDLNDASKISILALGSVQLISILLELNFVNNSLKILAANTHCDPQRYLYYLLLPVASMTVLGSYLYANLLFGSENLYVLIGCSCFIAVQQLTKIPDISIKLKGRIKATYAIETCSAALQIVLIIYFVYADLMSAQNVLTVMIFSQFMQLVVKTYMKTRIKYSGKYVYHKSISTLYNFYRPSFKFATTTFSTTLFVSLAVPMVSVRLPAAEGYFLLLAFRLLTYCDQLSWSPFYARLPLIHQDFRSDIKMSVEKYSNASQKVLRLFTVMSLGVVIFLLAPVVQLLFDFQLSIIIIPLLMIMLLNRAIAMNVQILFAIKNIEAPHVHLVVTLFSLIIYVNQPTYLLLSVIVFTSSLIWLHYRYYKLIIREL